MLESCEFTGSLGSIAIGVEGASDKTLFLKARELATTLLRPVPGAMKLV
mgnify:CR=1 FL=1